MNRMREARKRKRMTMKQLGQIIGVAESTVSMYETGKHEPNNSTLVKIADALNVPVDYLLGRTDIEKTEEWNNPELDRTESPLSETRSDTACVEVTPLEKTILETYRSLSEIEQTLICRSLGLAHPADHPGKPPRP